MFGGLEDDPVLALKIALPLLAYAAVWLQAYLDYKKGWRDKRTRLHRLGFRGLTWVVVPAAVLLTVILVVSEDRAAAAAEQQLASIRTTLDQVALVVGARSSDDLPRIVRELKAQVLEQGKQLESATDKIRTQGDNISTLEHRVAPRSISPGQVSAFVAALRGKTTATVHVQAVSGDEEAYMYAGRIKAALVEAGWTVIGVDRVVRMVPTVGTALMSGPNPPSPRFVDLLTAFRSAGIPARPTHSPPLGDGPVVVLIGVKEAEPR